MIGFSPAAQQLEESAAAYARAASALERVAARGEDCIGAVFASAQSVRWDSPAGQAFTALTYHHVASARAHQESVAELAVSAHTISQELHEYAHLARVLAGAVQALTGVEPDAVGLLGSARSAGESAGDFFEFLARHGGLPLTLLAGARGSQS